jgi:hypothetical protein
LATKKEGKQQEVVDSPDAIVNQSVSVAKAFMEIIEEQHKKGQDMYVTIGKKKYLLAHSWSFLLMLYEVHPVPIYVNEVREKDGRLIGYEAKVELQKHDQIHGQNYVVGAGIMFCGVNDWATKIRQGEDKRRPGESAAQTYAMSKAARLAYGHIPTLVGYEALPYEELLDSSGEVTDNNSAKPPLSKSDSKVADWVHDMPDDLRCPDHGLAWFQSKKMREMGLPYGHPIEGTKNEWCRMPEDMPVGENIVMKKKLGTPKNLAEFLESMEQEKVDQEKLKTILGCSIEEYLNESEVEEQTSIGLAYGLVRDVLREESAIATQELFG